MGGRRHRSQRGDGSEPRSGWLLVLIAVLFIGVVGIGAATASAAEPPEPSPVPGDGTPIGVSPVAPPEGAQTFTPAATCNGRVQFRVTTGLYVDGRLNGVVTANGGNTIRRLFFFAGRASSNALIDIGTMVGQGSPFDVTLPAGTTQASFFVRPAVAGIAPVTASFIVQDDCGFFQSLVGGGTRVNFGAAVPGAVVNACNNRTVNSGVVTVAVPGATLAYPINSGGTFFAFVPRGTQTIVASAAGFTSGGVTGNFGPGPHPGVAIALNGPTGGLTGVVTDAEDGTAVAGATVTVSGGGSTTTNASGVFSFSNAPTGTQTITVTKTGYEPGSTTAKVCPDSTAQVAIALQQLGDLRGAVSDAICGNPISGAVISLSNGRSATTDSVGGYAINDISAGSYTATAAATDFTSASRSVTIQNGFITTQDFILSGGPTGTVRVAVTNAATGAPISGATVQVVGGPSGTTNSSGVATITGVTPANTITVQVTASGFSSSTLTGRLCPGGLTTGSTALTPNTGTITGTITDCATGRPISGATVSTTTGQTTTTAADGTYTLSNVPTGANTVTAAQTGYTSKSQAVTVVSGANPAVNLCLQPGRGSITGTVTNCRTGQPEPGVLASVTGQLGNATTDAAGSYTINNVPAGSQHVAFTKQGFILVDLQVTVVAGSTVTLNAAICPETGSDIVIVLTWGATPSDLDSHLYYPDAIGGQPTLHCKYPPPCNSGHPWVSLDVDDTTSFGPETIVIKKNPATNQYVAGDYHYWVHWFSPTPTPNWSTSGARVRVLQGSQELANFEVGGSTERIWYVFNVAVTATGNATITPVLQFKTGDQNSVF